MAQLPRAQLSVSSELQSMARMRAHARELSAKDAVWQQQLLGARPPPSSTAVPPSLQQPPPLVPVPPPLNTSAVVVAAAAAAALSPTPHTPDMCASPVSPNEMTHTNNNNPAVPPLPLSLRNPQVITTSTTIKQNNSRPKRGSGRIRRKRLTKEEEARFPVEELVDLTGTTAARSRKMSRKEHDLMLHKRRLRNRESAARSREKQRRTTTELAAEIDALNQRTVQLEDACKRAADAARHHAARAEALARTNAALAAELATIRGTRRQQVVVPMDTAAQPQQQPQQQLQLQPQQQPSNIITDALPPHSIAGSIPMSCVSSASLVNATAGLAVASAPSVPVSVTNVPVSGGVPVVSSQAPGFSSDTLDRLLADPPLPPMSRAPSLHRLGSWSSMRPDHHPASNTLRKQNSLLFMEFDGNAPSLSQDMAALLPASAAPL